MNALEKSLVRLEGEFASKWGDFTLFALLPCDKLPNRWDLVIAASWADRDTAKASRRISEQLQRKLCLSGLLLISRVIVALSNDPDVEYLRRMTRGAEDLPIELGGRELFGAPRRNVIIFSMKPRRVRRAAAASTRLAFS
jgi:hypothetical protein